MISNYELSRIFQTNSNVFTRWENRNNFNYRKIVLKFLKNIDAAELEYLLLNINCNTIDITKEKKKFIKKKFLISSRTQSTWNNYEINDYRKKILFLLNTLSSSEIENIYKKSKVCDIDIINFFELEIIDYEKISPDVKMILGNLINSQLIKIRERTDALTIKKLSELLEVGQTPLGVLSFLSKLTRKEILYYLDYVPLSIKEISTLLKVNDKTLYSWKKRKDFKLLIVLFLEIIPGKDLLRSSKEQGPSKLVLKFFKIPIQTQKNELEKEQNTILKKILKLLLDFSEEELTFYFNLVDH